MSCYFCLYIKPGIDSRSEYLFELLEVYPITNTSYIYSSFPSYTSDIESLAKHIAKVLNTIIPGLKLKKLKIEKGLNKIQLPKLSLIKKYRKTGIKYITTKLKEETAKQNIKLVANN